MNESAKRRLIWEVVLCFALPSYHLLAGVLMSPLLMMGAFRGIPYVLIHLLCTIGGCLGLVALVKMLRYVLRPKVDRLPWRFVLPSTAVGLASIWTAMTGQFAGFSLDWFSVMGMIAPTLCTVHIVWLARRKARQQPPNDASQPIAGENTLSG